ncbi:MAG: hypothetical protein CM15mP102_02950 [Flavobacteriales bacterium]|nr:MAG: hypothetical protein CM15mP102_02950 [Flavobacteriales bacterium]
MIIKDGYIIASWGDTKRVDMTFSVTKSYLSAITGIAVDKNLLDQKKILYLIMFGTKHLMEKK